MRGTRLVWSSLVVILFCSSARCSEDSFSGTLGFGEHVQLTLTAGIARSISVAVNTSCAGFSSFLLQAHAESFPLTLTNMSHDCTYARECVTNGTHIGMVQIINYGVIPVPDFSLAYYCSTPGSSTGGSLNCSSTQKVLVAVVGVPIYHPVPGGCSLTSALEIDASLTVTLKNSKSLNVTFQSSDIGFDPQFTAQPPCTDKFKFIEHLDYEIHHKCLSKPTTDSVFSALLSMLTVEDIDRSYMHRYPVKTFTFSEAKRILYYFQTDAAIFNVIAKHTNTVNKTAYIPSVAYGCDYSSGSCDNSIPIMSWVCGFLVGLGGLYLCLLAHTFFHTEIVVFSMFIFSYAMYMLLSALTDWEGVELAVCTFCLGVALTVLVFVLWFFTNWRHTFLLAFGMSMGFVLTAAALYTPFGSLNVVKVTYVYWLIIACGSFIVMVPMVLVSATIMNIVSTSVVGSFSVMFGTSLVVRSSFSNIILRVVWNAAIPGYLSVNAFCAPSTIDIIFWCLWGLLSLLSIVVQGSLELLRRRNFKRKQRQTRTYTSYEVGTKRKQYSPFPRVSLYTRCKRAWRKGRVYTPQFRDEPYGGVAEDRRPVSGEQRPLLSPSRLRGNSGDSNGLGGQSRYQSVAKGSAK